MRPEAAESFTISFIVSQPIVQGCIPFAGMRKGKMIAIGICPLAYRLASIMCKVVTQKDRRLLGAAIRTYRKLQGLTQEKLAEKVDLNPVQRETVRAID